MRAKDTKRRSLAAHVLRWYARHGRDLPWRHTSEPYRILLSETMLQQTQVARVLEKYPAFLNRFPSLPALARAPRSAVVHAWSGMGYNNRAVRLHRLALRVVQNGGTLPRDPAALHRLPGVGAYTRDAVCAFAYRRRVPVVDVNVRRVLSRLSGRMRDTASLLPEAEVRRIAAELLPERRYYAWNQALMDLGATVCTARRPACDTCPVARHCRSRGGMREARKKPRREPSMRGVPNRIYRGRLVEELRRAPRGRALPAAMLGRRILPGFGEAQHRWLGGILAGLERDGLVRVRGNSALTRRKVSLA